MTWNENEWTEQQEAGMLDLYWTVLAKDATAADTPVPPSGLDLQIATLARRLAREIHIPAPRPAFVDALRQQLDVHAARTLPMGHVPVAGRARPARLSRPLVRPLPLKRWQRPLALVTAAALLLALLGSAVGVYLWSSPPQIVSAQAIVRRAVGAVAALGTPAGAVHSFTLTETVTRVPSNSGLPLFAGYRGTIRSRVRRWYEAPNRWRIERRYITEPRGFLAREYDAPETQVSNGHILWDYNVAGNAVSIEPLAGQSGTADLFPLGQGDAAPSAGQRPGTLGAVLQEATTCYTPMLQGNATVAGHDTYVIDLERSGCYSASAHEIDGRLMLWVDKQTFFVLKSVLYDVGNRTRPYVTTTVTDIQYNAPRPIDPAIFTFTPPLGATLVDERPGGAPGGALNVGRYRATLLRLAARAAFPLFVPTEELAGLSLHAPRVDTRTGEGCAPPRVLRLLYAPPTARNAYVPRDTVLITQCKATAADVTRIPPGARPVLIGVWDSQTTLSGWYRPGSGAVGNTVFFVRNGTYIGLASGVLSRYSLVQLAGSLTPIPGGHALRPNPTLHGLTALRPRLPFPLFVPTYVPRGLSLEEPTLGSGVGVTLNYRDRTGSVALSILEGAEGCCIDQDARKGGQPVALPHGITGHFMPNEPRFGGPFLWWHQDGAFIAVSGPYLTKRVEARIAASMHEF